jgi:hypothetical protein
MEEEELTLLFLGRLFFSENNECLAINIPIPENNFL